MTTTIIIAAIVALGALILYINSKPDEFRVTRTAKINAAPAAIYPWLNNLKKGSEWSPWVQEEPDANYKYEGPDEGPGAATSWNGKKSGAGILTIMQSVPNERVSLRLQFFKPMKCVNTVEYTLTPANDGTTMAWTMYGPNNFIGKAMGMVMDCDKMCGDMFVKGMNNLKHKVEG